MQDSAAPRQTGWPSGNGASELRSARDCAAKQRCKDQSVAVWDLRFGCRRPPHAATRSSKCTPAALLLEPKLRHHMHQCQATVQAGTAGSGEGVAWLNGAHCVSNGSASAGGCGGLLGELRGGAAGTEIAT